jgi:hypothetical protein
VTCNSKPSNFLPVVVASPNATRKPVSKPHHICYSTKHLLSKTSTVFGHYERIALPGKTDSSFPQSSLFLFPGRIILAHVQECAEITNQAVPAHYYRGHSLRNITGRCTPRGYQIGSDCTLEKSSLQYANSKASSYN